MPMISDLTDTELLLKYDKLNDYLVLVKKEVKRRGLRKTFTDHISTWLDPSDTTVTRAAPPPPPAATYSRVRTVVKKKPTSTRIEVVESSSDDTDPA